MSGPGESCNQEHTLMHTHTHAHTRSHIPGCVCSHTRTLWGTWRVLGPGGGVWGGPGGSWGSSLCLVSVGAAGEEQVCARPMCACVWLLYPAAGLGWAGGWGGCPTAPGPRGQRGQSQKHGWLPTQPERRGGMSDGGGLPMCCAVTSAWGGRLCCAWLGQGHPGAWPLTAGNLGGRHSPCMWLPSPILTGPHAHPPTQQD